MKSYELWFKTPVGSFCRWFLLMYTGVLFIGNKSTVVIAGIAFACAFYIFVAGLFKRVFAILAFLGMPTIGNHIRRYKKLWPVIKNGPIQTVIKVHLSPPTP
jgi:hypothetical protein